MWAYNYELYHHGILGQKWGVRRYQNPDGTLTEEGKKRYGTYGPKRITYDEIANDRDNYQIRAWESSKALAKANELDEQYRLGESELKNMKNASEDEIKKKRKELDLLFEKYGELARQADRESEEEAALYIIEKYGKQRVDALTEKRNRDLERIRSRRSLSSTRDSIEAKIASFLDRAMGYTKHS